MFTWIEGTENLTLLTVKAKDKIITPSYKTSSSSPTAITSNTVKASISSTCSTQQKMSTGNLPKVNTLQRSSTGTWTNDKKTLDTSTSEQDIANKLGQTF